MGRGGDDIIDGDKWLNVQHRRSCGVSARHRRHRAPIAGIAQQHDDAAANRMFNGEINPGPARRSSARSRPQTRMRSPTSTPPSTRATARNTPSRPRPTGRSSSRMRSRTRSTAPTALRNIEKVAVRSTATRSTSSSGRRQRRPQRHGAGRPDPRPCRRRHAQRLATATTSWSVGRVAHAGGTYADNFNTSSFGNSTGTTNWDPDWVETNDSGGVDHWPDPDR